MTVGFQDPPVRYDFSRTREELRQMGHNARQAPSGNSHITGLTSMDMTYTIHAGFTLVTRPGLGVCAWPGDIRIRIGHEQMTVYVDRRYPPGTCQHRAVLLHENEHVRINREALQALRIQVQTALQPVVDRSFPLPGHSEEEVRTRSMGVLQAAMADLVARIQTGRDARHRALDSPAGYERTRRMCPAW
ncbi:MAG: hypothetical protein M3O22_00185 [Pseudomonadota bacterium]|nr:hypothetical protein [Pseudomonadota bacterium]